MNLLLGILHPSSGSISLGQQSLATVDLESWRMGIGTVMQDDTLFAGSIADNICFFYHQPDLEWITECARTAAIAADILAMPMGFQTLVGDMGTVLSGGQKQRILLARALYKKPRLLLLDEATSHLDLKREVEVNQALARLHMAKIIVAHRPQTIGSAQRVIELDGGRVSFDGSAAAYFQHAGLTPSSGLTS